MYHPKLPELRGLGAWRWLMSCAHEWGGGRGATLREDAGDGGQIVGPVALGQSQEIAAW